MLKNSLLRLIPLITDPFFRDTENESCQRRTYTNAAQYKQRESAQGEERRPPD